MFTYFNMDDNQSSSQNTNEWREIQPYMFESNKNECSDNSYDSDDESTSTEEEEEGIDHEFEAINSWRLSTLEWCKCGHCAIMEKKHREFLLPRKGRQVRREINLCPRSRINMYNRIVCVYPKYVVGGSARG